MTAAGRTAGGDVMIVDLVRELCLETLDEVRDPSLAAETRQLLAGLDGPQHARAGLVGLHSVARRLAKIDPELGRWLARELERVEVSVLAATRVRLLHLVLGGATQLSEAEVSDLARLANYDGGQVQLNATYAEPAAIAAALAAVDSWRIRAGDPTVDSTTREACELGARLCESLVASLRAPNSPD